VYDHPAGEHDRALVAEAMHGQHAQAHGRVSDRAWWLMAGRASGHGRASSLLPR